MKKINKNAVVFIIVFILVGVGLFSEKIPDAMKKIPEEIAENRGVYGVAHSFKLATDTFEKNLADGVFYHEAAMDINSLFNRYLGRAIVEKPDGTIIRANNGYLGNPRWRLPDEQLNRWADNVAGFMQTANSKGAQFLYVMAPSKGYSLDYPSNGRDLTKHNCDTFAKMLRKRNVPFFSLIEQSEKENITNEEMFFITDHHWLPERGLWAADRVSSYLGELYGYEYDKSLLDESNFDITVYEDWFLGSQGKKVGRYFSQLGVDDIKLIVPKYPTSMAEYQPAKALWREGSFEDLLYMENLTEKDHYNLNPYATYSGGDFREQIINNRLNPDGKTVLIIRDSFGCAFTPFLSLVMENLHVVDIRDGGYVGEKLNLPRYIDTVKPDYVIVFYTGVSDADALYTFE